MKPLLAVLLFVLAGTSVPALNLPPIVREAVRLELEGRLGEALDRYRAALSTEPSLVKDETLAQPLTVYVLSKAAHLSVDLGYGDEAWDLGSRLLAAGNQPASEAGTLVKMRIFRLQGRYAEALKLSDSHQKSWPKPGPGPALAAEIRRVRTQSLPGTAKQSALALQGPASWILGGAWGALPGPTEVLGLSVQETARLQVGAFQEWGHALTLIDMLREKGWVPFTDVKTGSDGQKLHLVYIVSRQPATDRARLEAQGLNALP